MFFSSMGMCNGGTSKIWSISGFNNNSAIHVSGGKVVAGPI
jgi:hypothetical protein